MGQPVQQGLPVAPEDQGCQERTQLLWGMRQAHNQNHLTSCSVCMLGRLSIHEQRGWGRIQTYQLRP